MSLSTIPPERALAAEAYSWAYAFQAALAVEKERTDEFDTLLESDIEALGEPSGEPSEAQRATEKPVEGSANLED